MFSILSLLCCGIDFAHSCTLAPTDLQLALLILASAVCGRADRHMRYDLQDVLIDIGTDEEDADVSDATTRLVEAATSAAISANEEREQANEQYPAKRIEDPQASSSSSSAQQPKVVCSNILILANIMIGRQVGVTSKNSMRSHTSQTCHTRTNKLLCRQYVAIQDSLSASAGLHRRLCQQLHINISRSESAEQHQ